MIAGFEKPTSGEIMLDGKSVLDIPPHMRPVNTVFQRYALFPHLNVFDNIAFGLKLKKKELCTDVKGYMARRKAIKNLISEKVKKALKIVGLTDYEYRNVTSLSGGISPLVGFSKPAIILKVVVLPQPLGPRRQEMQLELKNMHRRLGITFVYVTHDQEEALTMSDRIVVMKNGIIHQVGTPIDIYNEPSNAFVADFIGESNIILWLVYNGTRNGNPLLLTTTKTCYISVFIVSKSNNFKSFFNILKMQAIYLQK